MNIFGHGLSAGGRRYSGVLIVMALLFCWMTVSSAVRAEGLDRIESLIVAGKHSQALDQLQPLLARRPVAADVRFMQARALIGLGKQQQARRILEDLLKELPDRPEIYNNLAVIYANQGDLDKARSLLESALATQRGYQLSYQNLGVIYDHLASLAYGQALSPDETVRTPELHLTLLENLPIQATASNVAPDSTLPSTSMAPPPQSGSDDQARAIRTMVLAWARAWEAQQADSYLDFYDKNFIPPDGRSRKDWERSRRLRLRTPEFIRVEVDNISVAVIDEHAGSVFLRQHYSSDLLNDTVVKNLIVRKAGGQWRIFQENLIR